MRKAIGWLLTPLHLAAFLAVLLTFHIAQVLASRFGYAAHKRVVDYLNLCILASLKIVGTRIEIDCPRPLPSDVPLIVVANHQSMYDIPLLGWIFRRHHPKYVAKVELGKGLPSISYNLRHGGSALIDRENPRTSMRAIQKFGKEVEAHRYAACIFPEGTRARDGVMKPFNPAGLMVLMRAVPSGVIVPVAIEGSWQIVRYAMRPIPFGVHMRCTVLAPIDRTQGDAREVVALAEQRIRAVLEAS